MDIVEEVGKDRPLFKGLAQKSVQLVTGFGTWRGKFGTGAVVRTGACGVGSFGRVKQIVCHSFCRFSSPYFVPGTAGL